MKEGMLRVLPPHSFVPPPSPSLTRPPTPLYPHLWVAWLPTFRCVKTSPGARPMITLA